MIDRMKDFKPKNYKTGKISFQNSNLKSVDWENKEMSIPESNYSQKSVSYQGKRSI